MFRSSNRPNRDTAQPALLEIQLLGKPISYDRRRPHDAFVTHGSDYNSTNRYCFRQISYCQILWLHNGAAEDSGLPECDAVSLVVGFSTIRKITFKDKAVLSCLTPEDVGITFLRKAGNYTLMTVSHSNIQSGAFSAVDDTA
jgi:hypothetical protein